MSPPHSPPLIAPQALHALLLGNQELALLDVREARAYVSGHLNLARLAPLSTLQLDVQALVPRAGTPIVLVDAGDPQGPSLPAARALARLGYTDVRVLEGGIAAWQAAGYPLIDGYATLVKAFGDQVRRHYETPSVSGESVRAHQAAGRPVTLIDVRPADEYAFLSLPASGNHPGTEVTLRQWPGNAQTARWVVNCFSRTRGIIGTTTLHLLGHPDVHFLEDGVMQWALDAAPVARDAPPALALPVASGEALQARADTLIQRYGLSLLQVDALADLRAEVDRTLHVFDLRPAVEGCNAPPGVRAVPGGQLLMHFESLVGTRHARIVLLDDSHRLRAAVTAFWLRQLNQSEVFILDGELPAASQNEIRNRTKPMASAAEGLSPRQLASLLEAAPDRVKIVDVGPSHDFERGHLPGAYFLLPFTLEPLAAFQKSGERIIFSSPDGRAAELSARDACERWPRSNAGWLIDGTQAWQMQGLPTEQTWEATQLLTPFEDDWGSVMRVPTQQRDRAWTDYLAWERSLSERVAQDPTVCFRFF
ncbi:rhodanese-like domain-containing protein [Variovorax fucosicus]|uniref:rhodanese-like domain-containing protein n=1 Tax=Variovorax fucosicus TaxID=3053517 RepID=UPI002574DDE7|nr:rhodanese-like domain-containing protein [Variovorax sp. J22G47]MDM0059071.1 rhodanese-like domain-containing protein [Variovorax sp. J22G47]